MNYITIASNDVTFFASGGGSCGIVCLLNNPPAMRKTLFIAAFALLFFPQPHYGQVPDLGSLAGFVLFTTTGAVGNTGLSQIGGNIGTNAGAVTGFDPPTIVAGTIYIGNAVTVQGITDLTTAYTQLYITGHQLQLQLHGQPKGNHMISLYNLQGGKVMSTQIIHDGHDGVRMIRLDKNFTSGIYYLEIKGPDNHKQICKVLIQ